LTEILRVKTLVFNQNNRLSQFLLKPVNHKLFRHLYDKFIIQSCKAAEKALFISPL